MSQNAAKRSRDSRRRRRHVRIRKRIRGTPERPRLAVYRSLKNVEAQIIDDEAGRTLLGLSTLHKDVRGVSATKDESTSLARAREAGKRIAALAKENGIAQVVFDRGGYKYHGRIQAFAEGAREGGLDF